jgi:hypothetical protein
MAKISTNNRIGSNSKKRRGIHSKKKSSPNKNSKHYKKKYRGQGK